MTDYFTHQKKSALKIDFSNVEKLSFYIPIYDNTQFILQSLRNLKLLIITIL